MERAVAFADALDEALRAGETGGVRVGMAGRGAGPAIAGPAAFAFADAWLGQARAMTPRPVPVGAPERPARPVPDGLVPAGVARLERSDRAGARRDRRPLADGLEWLQFRRVHPFTPRQRRALDAIVDLGVALPPDFTTAQLRSAFRRLARQFHPDRHRGSDPAESARLARTFARLTDDYRCLLELVADGN